MFMHTMVYNYPSASVLPAPNLMLKLKHATADGLQTPDAYLHVIRFAKSVGFPWTVDLGSTV